jgi:hypothetical protein
VSEASRLRDKRDCRYLILQRVLTIAAATHLRPEFVVGTAASDHEAQAISGTYATLRPRRAVHLFVWQQAPPKRKASTFDGESWFGLDNTLAESFVATLKTELL